MGIGVSVFLFAVGAILTFAVNATVSGIDIATVGVILMIAGRHRPDHDHCSSSGRRGSAARDRRRGLRPPPPGRARRRHLSRRPAQLD